MSKLLAVIPFFLFIFVSCETSDVDGKWDDNIKLSENNITISAEANTVLITTKGSSWWVAGIILNDDSDYDISDIDTTQLDFVISTEDFIIERKNAKEIHVSITPNNTGLERTLTVSLQAGNYFDGFNVHQTID
ncbi:hypothetical protein QSV08_12570 [Maribacter sp. BPC-D8]|uniref:BACON domain-containing protein n=1 Tax=Maribacter sp. BPC-D8 TaxID=3053613 RepID=UPI002B482C1B|nr:BACON domain-containing carbohydrate-binding protein [Maribacter sp. BPC-D8]WRI28059.1 hypothetical protein QSV08_12570 [Maribacter sp. BPC-D8]